MELFTLLLNSWMLIPFILIGYILYHLILIVRQQQVAIVERLGKFNRISQPGLTLLIPVLERAHFVELRLQQLEIKVETKTKDNVFVGILVSVQYLVENTQDAVYKSYYELSDPETQIEAYILDIVRASVPKMELDDVFANKDSIALDILNNLQETMSTYGFKIRQALVTDIAPNEEVKKSMNRINAAKRELAAAQFEANSKQILLLAEAEAEAKSKKMQGEGTANQRIEIARGIRESAVMLQEAGLPTQEVFATLLAVQWVDAISSSAGRANATVIMMPNSPTSGFDIGQQILAAAKTLQGENEKKPA